MSCFLQPYDAFIVKHGSCRFHVKRKGAFCKYEIERCYGLYIRSDLIRMFAACVRELCKDAFYFIGFFEAGTLAAAVAGSIPSGSEIEFAGGTLSVGAGVSVPEDLAVDLSAYSVEEGKTGRWTLMTAEGGMLSTTPVVQGLESGWIAEAKGNTLQLRRIRGVLFSIR